MIITMQTVKTTIADANREFLKLLTKGAPPNHLKTFFLAKYSVYIYKITYSFFAKRERRPLSEEKIDTINEISTNIIETIATNISMSKLTYEGKSAFSTYIYGMMKSKYREHYKKRRYIPEAVQALDNISRNLYQLVYEDSFTLTEAFGIAKAEWGYSESEIAEGHAKLVTAMKKAKVSAEKFIDQKAANIEDFDEFIQEKITAVADSPEAHFLKSQIQEKCRLIFDEIGEKYTKYIKLRFIAEKKANEIYRIMGDKSAQQSSNRILQAKEAFIKAAERLHLKDFFYQYLQGEAA